MPDERFKVIVQQADFDVSSLQRALLQGDHQEGAIASFTGCVRASNARGDVATMELEHYPGMTENSIRAILDEAAGRWPLLSATVVHRVGRLCPGEQIVWVGVASAHREAAFNACEFVMDYLKTRAPFWKRELGEQGAVWVDARESDVQRAKRWLQSDE